MRLGLVSGLYTNKYVAVNTRNVINWMIHKDLMEGEESKYKKSLMAFPGLVSLVDTGGTVARGIYVARTLTYNRCFAVVNQTLYEIALDGTATSRGTLTNLTGDDRVWMRVNGNNQMMIAGFAASYSYDLSTDTLSQITDGDFPGSVTYLDYSVGYMFICSGGRVWYSDLNSTVNWTASSVFTPIASADNVMAAVIWKDDIYCFGSESIETYINDGTTPFVKQVKTTMPIGLVAVNSIQVTEHGIIFLGKTKTGQAKVYLYDGQSVEPLSPLSTSYAVNNPSVLSTMTETTWDADTGLWDDDNTPWEWIGSDAFNNSQIYADLTYTKYGNALYHLTIPQSHATYVFDLITKEWVERQSLNPGTSSQTRYRGFQTVNFQGMNLVLDIFSGKVFYESYDVITEDSQVVTRTVVSGILHNEKKNVGIYEVEVDMTTGVGLQATPATAANVSLYYSRDGGNTYSSAISLSTGASGSYYQRPRVGSLGTARDWVFKLVLTDKADLAINDILIHGQVNSF